MIEKVWDTILKASDKKLIREKKTSAQYLQLNTMNVW